MSTRTLLLTPWMSPHRVISWQRAVTLAFLGKVQVLEEYEDAIAAPSVTIKMPAVVRLTQGGVTKKHKVRFSRMNVFTRDGFRCQYCGVRKGMSELNYDHVVPRLRGGKTVWENIATSCYPCNDRKGSRTPEEAGMTLVRKPFKPHTLPLVPIIQSVREIPPVWRDYCATEGRGADDVRDQVA